MVFIINAIVNDLLFSIIFILPAANVYSSYKYLIFYYLLIRFKQPFLKFGLISFWIGMLIMSERNDERNVERALLFTYNKEAFNTTRSTALH